MNREWMKKNTREDKILFAGFQQLKELEKYPDSDEKKELLQKLEVAKQNHSPSEKYGENGSRFSDEWLEEIGGLPIVYPLEWMSDFVPIGIKLKVDNNDKQILSAPSKYLKSSDLYYVFMYMNPQLIGTFAYILLNTKDEDVFNSALEFLDLYREYYLARLKNDREELSKQVDEYEKWLKSLN